MCVDVHEAKEKVMPEADYDNHLVASDFYDADSEKDMKGVFTDGQRLVRVYSK